MDTSKKDSKAIEQLTRDLARLYSDFDRLFVEVGRIRDSVAQRIAASAEQSDMRTPSHTLRHPSHPAIPDEVRGTIKALCNFVENLSLQSMVFGRKAEAIAAVPQLRDWLAQCPTAEPQRPAIPEGVAEYIRARVESDCCSGGENCRSDDTCTVTRNKRLTLDWLAQCSMAGSTCQKCGAKYSGARCPLCVEGKEITEKEWNDHESLMSAITKACDAAGYHFGFGEGVDVAASAAMEWFKSQFPTATDKAVCPECGGTDAAYPSCARAFCWVCISNFPVQVAVISPPRAPKVEPGKALTDDELRAALDELQKRSLIRR